MFAGWKFNFRHQETSPRLAALSIRDHKVQGKSQCKVCPSSPGLCSLNCVTRSKGNQEDPKEGQEASFDETAFQRKITPLP